MKIRPVGAEFFHADGRTYDEANSGFSQFLQTHLKKKALLASSSLSARSSVTTP